MFLFKTIALCGTCCVIADIQAWSFTKVNSLRLQSQCLAKAAFCKAPKRTSKTCPFGDRVQRSPIYRPDKTRSTLTS